MNNEDEILNAFIWARECVQDLLKVKPICNESCHCRYCSAQFMLSVTTHIDSNGVNEIEYVEMKGPKRE